MWTSSASLPGASGKGEGRSCGQGGSPGSALEATCEAAFVWGRVWEASAAVDCPARRGERGPMSDLCRLRAGRELSEKAAGVGEFRSEWR